MSAAERVEHDATVIHLPNSAPAEPPAVVEPKAPLLPRVAAYWQPPDIWSDDRPSLRKVWMHARHGLWTQTTGVLRVLGAIDAFVLVFPPHAVLYTLLWLWERPARRLVAATVAALIYLAF